MTRKQFLSWLAGFSEGIGEGVAPTWRQFKRVTDKLEHELDFEPMNFGQFYHRYVTPYQEHWNKMASDDTNETVVVGQEQIERLMHRNGHALWKAAGRAEFLALEEGEANALQAQASEKEKDPAEQTPAGNEKSEEGEAKP